MIFNSFDLFASISTPFANEIKAVIFDCDGVLVDTEYLKFLAWQKALASVNIELSIEEYKAVAGHSSKKIHEMLARDEKSCYSRRSHSFKTCKNIESCRHREYRQLRKWLNLLSYLSQNKDVLGNKVGLASSASTNEILFNLKQIGLDQAFDLIISGSDDLNDYT